MSDWMMLNASQVVELGLSSMLVLRQEYEAAMARIEPVRAAYKSDPKEAAAAAAAAAVDAVLFEDGPQEPQEEAPATPDVSVEAGVAKKPRRARKPAGGVDAGQFIPDDPATPDVDESCEPAEA